MTIMMSIKAQFKGFPTLSYTLIESGDPDEYTFALSYLVKSSGNRNIKMITVHLKNDDEQEQTEFRVAEFNPDYLASLADLKEFLEKEQKKKD